MPSNAIDAEVFIYTGNDVPRDVVRVRVDPSVTTIPAYAFYERTMLAEVELCEGVVEIGDSSFGDCSHSISKIIFPTSLRRIQNCAFADSLRCPIRLHDGIESIEAGAFAACIFTNFRVLPLITVIPQYMLNGCTSLFSVEIPLTVMDIEHGAFGYCYCLRNLALPPNAVIGNNIFILNAATDLLQLFGSELEIIRELKHRFDGLLIHCAVYYKSYQQGV
jgi:hypothetical protein